MSEQQEKEMGGTIEGKKMPEVPSSEASKPSLRPSLKEIAERASQAGVSSRPSIPPGSQVGAVPGSRPSLTSIASARISVVPAPMPEFDDDDSGVVQIPSLADQPSPMEAPPVTRRSAAPFPPASELQGAGAMSAPLPPPPMVPFSAPALPPPQKKTPTGLLVGVGLVSVCLVAGIVAWVVRDSKSSESTVVTSTPAVEGSAAAVATTITTDAMLSKETSTTNSALQESAIAESNPVTTAQTSSVAAKAAASAGGVVTTSSAMATGETKSSDGDLNQAIAQAASAGSTTNPVAATKKEEKVATSTPADKNQTIPEQPSQGALQAAVGSVMGAARACVADADGPTKAQITFGSAGTVSNVSVSGWAASNGASKCVSAALKPAKVPPFSKPSYSLGVTIRP